MNAALILIAGFAAVGLWLEGINGKHGLVDEFFAPAPFGCLGLAFVVLQGQFA